MQATTAATSESTHLASDIKITLRHYPRVVYFTNANCMNIFINHE